MPLPLFLPCAAGVEALLAEEIARVLPGTPLHAGAAVSRSKETRVRSCC
jgi:hypothetical protein